MSDTTDAASAPAPTIRITSGSATPEEIAALTVLLSAMPASEAPGEANLHRGWSRPSRRFVGFSAPGVGWGRR